jgi:HAD superfamily hydrolase (TIGR01450 family)
VTNAWLDSARLDSARLDSAQLDSARVDSARTAGDPRPSCHSQVCQYPPMTNQPSADLRASLAGVRGLVLDLDGVLILSGALIPGAREALAELDARGFPYVIGTNMSLASRVTLSRELTRGGLPVPAERIVNAASTAASLARRRFGREPIYVMGSDDAMDEFSGMYLLSHEDAADPDRQAAAVIVGDAGNDFTPRNIQSAFRLLRGGAQFVAMHKNRWWITPAGVLLDSGSYVAALEFGLERKALVAGKPSRAFFGEAVRTLSEGSGAGVGAAVGAGAADGRKPSNRLSAAQVAMVGDDLWNDIRGAQKAGLRGVFVRSGKHGEAELVRVTSGRGGRGGRGSWAPDAIAPSIVEIVAALPR